MDSEQSNNNNPEENPSTNQRHENAVLGLIELGKEKQVASPQTSKNPSDGVEVLDKGSNEENQDPREPQEGLNRNTLIINTGSQVESNSNESGFVQLQRSLIAEKLAIKREVKETLLNADANSDQVRHKCMFKNCEKVIRGRGNFRKHLDWHIKEFDDRYTKFIGEGGEWEELKTKIPRVSEYN